MVAKIEKTKEQRRAIEQARKPVASLEEAQGRDPHVKGFAIYQVTDGGGRKVFLWENGRAGR
jgi:hypothetical protein